MTNINFYIDQDVFELFKKGDSIAFEKIYNLYSDLIFSKVYRLCTQVDICSDIVQESFTKLFINRHKIQDSEGIFPFLYIVSRRLAISTFRNCIAKKNYEYYLTKHYDEKEQCLMENIVSKDLKENIYNALECLPEQQAKVFKLNKVDELSYKEIADRLGISHHTVRNLIALATRTIRHRVNRFLTILF